MSFSQETTSHVLQRMGTFPTPFQWYHMSPLSCHYCTAYPVCPCQARHRALVRSDLVQQMPVISTPHCYRPLMGWPKLERYKCSIKTKTLSSPAGVQQYRETRLPNPWKSSPILGCCRKQPGWHRCANPLMHCKCSGSENVLLNQDSKCTKDLYQIISIIYSKVKYKYILPTCLILNTDK